MVVVTVKPTVGFRRSGLGRYHLKLPSHTILCLKLPGRPQWKPLQAFDLSCHLNLSFVDL